MELDHRLSCFSQTFANACRAKGDFLLQNPTFYSFFLFVFVAVNVADRGWGSQ